MELYPASNVSIVGFPFGLAQGAGLPIWKTGTIASDLDVDYGGLPQFLVDCTGRSGMSGSPVFARATSGFATSQAAMKIGGGVTDRFLGIYAGRIGEDTEIGRVFKAAAIMQIYTYL
jgi:hypothetical protein